MECDSVNNNTVGGTSHPHDTSLWCIRGIQVIITVRQICIRHFSYFIFKFRLVPFLKWNARVNSNLPVHYQLALKVPERNSRLFKTTSYD